MQWIKKWLKQPRSIQVLILNYALYLLLLIGTTFFAYFRLTLVK